jgi:hypothetical protein
LSNCMGLEKGFLNFRIGYSCEISTRNEWIEFFSLKL